MEKFSWTKSSFVLCWRKQKERKVKRCKKEKMTKRKEGNLRVGVGWAGTLPEPDI